MPKFALIYRDANPPSSPEEGQKHMEAWRAWSASLGDALIDPGMPFAKTVAVSEGGATEDIGPNSLNGVSILEVANCHEAREIAERCPHLGLGGDIVIAECLDMEM